MILLQLFSHSWSLAKYATGKLRYTTREFILQTDADADAEGKELFEELKTLFLNWI